jgi:hypothetical protein
MLTKTTGNVRWHSFWVRVSVVYSASCFYLLQAPLHPHVNVLLRNMLCLLHICFEPFEVVCNFAFRAWAASNLSSKQHFVDRGVWRGDDGKTALLRAPWRGRSDRSLGDNEKRKESLLGVRWEGDQVRKILCVWEGRLMAAVLRDNGGRSVAWGRAGEARLWINPNPISTHPRNLSREYGYRLSAAWLQLLISSQRPTFTTPKHRIH